MWKELEKTDLSAQEIEQLEELGRQLPIMAELAGADMFIDCMTPEGRVVVAAQASPSSVGSAYEKSVVGQYVLSHREPAVFHAFQLKAPVRDLKAITQEDRTVRQNVVPVLRGGRCIAVLISETDISGDLRQERKFRQLAQAYEEEDLSLRSSRIPGPEAESAALREIHHRIKNDLQLVASILNIHSRRCKDETAQKILRENVGRVLSIASIHDILTKRDGSSLEIDSITLLERLRENLLRLIPADKEISIRVDGTGAPLSADAASAVSVAVNELITNALEHAFVGRDQGEILVSFRPGVMFYTVTVSDNGVGFDVFAPRRKSLGLSIVDATVHDRLHGNLTVHSDGSGSRFSFDWKIE